MRFPALRLLPRTLADVVERPGQCAFYALPAPSSATIGVLRGPLEDGLRANSLVYARGDVEHKANTDFRKLNAKVREATTGTGAGRRNLKPKWPR